MRHETSPTLRDAGAGERRTLVIAAGNEIYELALTLDANDPASPSVLECGDEAIARIESSLDQ